ncbi:MAG: hypothetical protein ACXWG1_09370 [Usitatibacter sp.]
MANTFNGIGTTFYGKRQFEPDGSYVTTKWFVIAFVPVFPMGSLRVVPGDTTGIPFLSRSTSFEVVEELPINGAQVLSTYAYAIFIIAWILYFADRNMNGVAKFLVITAAVLVPTVLRHFGKMRAS